MLCWALKHAHLAPRLFSFRTLTERFKPVRVLSKVGAIVATPLLVFALSFIVHAQGDAKGNRGQVKVLKDPSPGPKTSGPKVIYRNRIVERIVRPTPTTGTLYISAEPGASIHLEYLTRSGEVAEESKNTIPAGERSIIFNGLRPGSYRVVAELDGHQPTDSAVQVNKGKSVKVDLNLVPITYNVTVRLNASSGMLTYAKGSEVPRSVNFQNNRAVLSGLTGGIYTIKIVPDDASYVPKDTSLTVSGESNEVEVKLDKKESKAFLGAATSDWALPGGWSFSSGKVIVNGSGIALPSDSSYRNYTDFQLTTDVRMKNGVAASFVVRCVDPQNYYLVQITGPNADEPYTLRGYLVRNGSVQRFGRSFPINQFSETLKPGKYFSVELTMTGSEISVKVRDSETGDLLKLGTLPDPSNTFRIGAVGIAARSNEQNEVGQFSICVSNCQNP